MTKLNFQFPTGTHPRILGQGTPSGWKITPIADRLGIVATKTNPKEGEAIFLQTSGLLDDEKRWLGFKWTFDNTGTWKYVPASHPHGNSKSHVWGHNTLHAWNTPGTKTVTLEAVYYDGAVGNIQTVTKTLTVTVSALSAGYTTAKTWVVSPDSTFTGAPAGNQVTTLAAAKAAADTATGAVLILLQRGKTHSAAGNLDFGRTKNNDVYVYAWGTGADPVIDISGGSSFNLTLAPDTVVFRDIKFNGTYDPATGNGGRTNAVRIGDCLSFTMNGCDGYGVQSLVSTIGYDETVPTGFRVFDTRVNRWENFGCYNQVLNLGGYRGFVFTQDLSAVNGDEGKPLGLEGNYPDHGPIRISSLKTACVQHGYSRTVNGWSKGNDPAANDTVYAGLMVHQASVRAGSTSAKDCDFSYTMNYNEGGGLSLEGSSSNGIETYGVAAVCMNYLIATANLGNFLQTGNTGVAIYNNIVNTPNVLFEGGGKRKPLYFTGSPNIQPGWDTGSIDVCFNLFLYQPSLANERGTSTLAELRDDNGFAKNSVKLHRANNIWYVPNQTLSGEAGPLTADGPLDTTPIGPAPTYAAQRRAGKNANPTFVDTQYATPAGANWSGRPLAGAGALNAVTGDDYTRRPVLDFTGAVRGATTAKGAYDGV